jgi:tetratricopeptide (TPR) repeat protein
LIGGAFLQPLLGLVEPLVDRFPAALVQGGAVKWRNCLAGDLLQGLGMQRDQRVEFSLLTRGRLFPLGAPLLGLLERGRRQFVIFGLLPGRCRALNPGFALGWFRSGWLRLWHGEPDLAIEYFQSSLRLSPRNPIAASFLGIGVGHALNRRFEKARLMLLRSLQESPNSVPTYRWLAVCCTQMGRLDEAREMINRLRTIVPIEQHTPAGIWPQYCNPEQHELYLSGLRLARRHDCGLDATSTTERAS